MAEGELSEVYVFCNICKENVPLEITEDDTEKAKTGLISVISVHGNPQHAILVYLDMNLKARGVEYPSLIQVDEETSLESEEPTSVKEDAIDLNTIISSFGEKQEQAIKAFAHISAQLIAGNTLYLIHNNKSIGRVIKDQIDSLFIDEKPSSFVITFDDIDYVSGMRPTIFDLQYGSFISEGIAIDTSHFEQIIRNALDSPNGFNILKNEYHKLKYSYRRLWELLTAGARVYTQKKLAYLVSIDLSLIPLLLRIAENDGVDVASRVKPMK
ncbi:MAG: hypothetical protein AM326_05990 [Candidatus Thorarchaeota archaeon SMTZ-45]|nr:MAG: hypothetical protein AM325_05755 [Candidatus Thorarchaeota archaeon SMTZ1-45]KXH76982.1 MAG: hypothetical protein AM326_05990 [Candidatus Thorarchaeota archaeon SMTZ-45]